MWVYPLLNLPRSVGFGIDRRLVRAFSLYLPDVGYNYYRPDEIKDNAPTRSPAPPIGIRTDRAEPLIEGTRLN